MLHSKASHVSHSVGTTTTSKNCREAHEDRRAAGGIGQDTSIGDVRSGLVEGEGAEGAGAASVDDTPVSV